MCGHVFAVPAPIPRELLKHQRIAPCRECNALLDVTEFTPGERVVCPQCLRVVEVPPVAPQAFPAQSSVSFWANAACVAAVLGAITFYPPIILAGLLCALAALWHIGRYPKRILGHNRAWASLVVSTAVLLAYLFLVPTGLKLFTRQLVPPDLVTDNAVPSLSGNAATAEKKAEPKPEAIPKGAYTSSVKDLLSYDKHLLDDSGVTFIFGRCDSRGFTFRTLHSKGTRDPTTKSGKKEFVFTD